MVAGFFCWGLTCSFCLYTRNDETFVVVSFKVFLPQQVTLKRGRYRFVVIKLRSTE